MNSSEIALNTISGHLPTEITSRLWALGLPTFARVDLLHATSFAFPPVIPKRPTTVFIHDLLWRDDAQQSLNKRGAAFHDRGLERAAKIASRLLVPSIPVADALAATGIDRAKIVVTGEGCDHLPLRPRRPDGPPILLSVGTIEPRKNLARLLAAFAQARSSLPNGTRLQLVGSDSWRGAPGLPADVPKGVEALGWVSDERLADLYARATAFVYPSLAEGFGLPPLEALRAGVPVICSPLPSITDALSPSPAVLIDPTDEGSIAEALIRVLTNEDTRRRLTQEGVDWTASRTWGAVAERHLAVWRTLW